MGNQKFRSGLGLGDSRSSLATGASAKYTTKVFSNSEFFQWQKAEVTEIDLNPESAGFTGRIRFRTYDDRGKDKDYLPFALPLIPYLRTYPVLHEIVAITEFDGKYYWLSPLNSLGFLNNNIQANLTETAPYQSGETSTDYKDSQAYGIPKSSDETGISYGKTFINNRFNVGILSPNEGDTILEGRFSNSIRLGNNPDTNLPNIKISVRDLLESFTLDKENLDEDSCIFITTDEILTFNPVGIEISDVNNPPHQYDGKQIMITSDRLIFGAKLNEILMFSNKSISFSSNENFSVDSGKQVMIKSAQEAKIEALKVMLGKWDADEPLVLGNKWKDAMITLIDVVLNHIHPTGTGPSGPLMPPQLADLNTLKTSVENKEQLSDDNFTTKKNK